MRTEEQTKAMTDLHNQLLDEFMTGDILEIAKAGGSAGDVLVLLGSMVGGALSAIETLYGLPFDAALIALVADVKKRRAEKYAHSGN